MPDTPDAVEPFVATALSASLTVRDLDASLAWYARVLGMGVQRRYERDGVLVAAALDAGAAALLLTRDDGARGADRAKGEGISLMLTTTQDIDRLAARAVAAGATLDAPPAEIRGMRAFRLRDPDGFRLTISSPRPDAPR